MIQVDPYVSVRSERRSVTHSSSSDRDRSGLRTANSDEHNYCSHSSTEQMSVSRTVLPAHAHVRGRVVTSCSLHALSSTCGVCPALFVRERGQQNTHTILPVRTYKTGFIHRNPGNRLIHSRRKKNLSRARHASYSSRIELKPRPQVPDGLPVSTYLAFWLKVLVRRDTIQNRRKNHKYTYFEVYMYHM